ncbi:division/cell wall cluster transcriptional repressor MraZ [candidate division NPL-UPA2 bacterium Unc8]|uniref:Transcriptional regulator MraZ n=1 Tax=candidate division NPL-UPA2 bacterium Unc8 TaxID=1980939 RepID=A0A399FTY9_UNCN2|nr:Transcriptional regulator MraZ [Bacillota bacterium]MBT9137744.1 Transcriptional regulator MraZ [Bacillota bacterium]MBT9146776.1 Transcriptional regulator MraZ [Bacillota bacterium]RIH99767.1 MAG: division/cell wall cluster transcriptional repressor MraZ [candidate division NPL-UPA2 bacterium Unc8]
MFYGEYKHAVDKKGRLTIPAKFRSLLKEKGIEALVVTRGYEKCLFVFPPDEWREYEQNLKSFSPHKINSRTVSRLFYSGANFCSCDRQGRINVSENLLAYAGITKEVTIIGTSSRFEIWDTTSWSKYREEHEKTFEEMAERLELKID